MQSSHGVAKHQSRQGFRDLLDMWNALLETLGGILAVVPSDHEVSLDLVVQALDAAVQKVREPVKVLDARGADIARGKHLAAEVRAKERAGERVVVVIDSPMLSLPGVDLLQCATDVLLVVRVGAGDLGALSSTVSLIGVDRIIGSVTAPAQ